MTLFHFVWSTNVTAAHKHTHTLCGMVLFYITTTAARRIKNCRKKEVGKDIERDMMGFMHVCTVLRTFGKLIARISCRTYRIKFESDEWKRVKIFIDCNSQPANLSSFAHIFTGRERKKNVLHFTLQWMCENQLCLLFVWMLNTK